jgi:hypothetical protein
VRGAGGTLTTFDVPGGGTSSYEGTVPYSINGRCGDRILL